jgi:hypothetical protein
MSDKNAPDTAELWQHIQDINSRVSTIEHRHGYVSTAFPQNDLGKPDYDGHRKAHLLMMDEAKVVAGYKQGVTKQILSILVTAMATLLLAGAVSYFTHATQIEAKK